MGNGPIGGNAGRDNVNLLTRDLTDFEAATICLLLRLAVWSVFACYVYVGVIDLVHWLAR